MNELKISKEEFVKALNDIKKGLERRDKFNDAIEDATDTFFICNIGDEFLNTAIHLLEIAVNDKEIPQVGTTISWWLFENVEKKITISEISPLNTQNEPIVVDCTTPEQLYDYFLNWN